MSDDLKWNDDPIIIGLARHNRYEALKFILRTKYKIKDATELIKEAQRLIKVQTQMQAQMQDRWQTQMQAQIQAIKDEIQAFKDQRLKDQRLKAEVQRLKEANKPEQPPEQPHDEGVWDQIDLLWNVGKKWWYGEYSKEKKKLKKS
eukprot:UN12453